MKGQISLVAVGCCRALKERLKLPKAQALRDLRLSAETLGWIESLSLARMYSPTLAVTSVSCLATPYSLNGTPNANREVRDGRYCAPITLGFLPMAFQTWSATAFI